MLPVPIKSSSQQDGTPIRVVLCGQTNVGKSSLFNAISRQSISIVDEQSGTSRDYGEALMQLASTSVCFVDTPGWTDHTPEEMSASLSRVAIEQCKRADIALFMFDGRADLIPIDFLLAQHLRRFAIPVIPIANKCEGRADTWSVYDGTRLGFGTPVEMSVSHRRGFRDLFERLEECIAGLDRQSASDQESKETKKPSIAIRPYSPTGRNAKDDVAPDEKEDKRPQLTIVGRPNSGKSTLINALLGFDRMLTGATPGLTRDSVSHDTDLGKRSWRLTDTAGFKRRPKTTERLDRLSTSQSIQSIDNASMVALVIDTLEGPKRQDSIIAARALKKGKCLIIVANKIDLVTSPRELRNIDDAYRHTWLDSISGLRGIPIVKISATEKKGIKDFIKCIDDNIVNWNRNFSTGVLNRWLQKALQNHPPPRVRSRQPQLRYITQLATSPPRFVVFSSVSADLPDSYRSYLGNHMRQEFKLQGIPLAFHVKKAQNPYTD